MREIATSAGVSVATVSKSLAGKNDVSRKTRARVLALCEKLGYKTNPLVSALMRSRRRHSFPEKGLTLAFVTAFPTPDGWKRHPAPIFRQMYAGAEARAEARCYHLEHHWLYRDGMSNRRFSEMLEARGIRGILFAPVPDTHTSIELNWAAFSIVVLGLTPSTRQFHRVTTDYYQSMMLVMEKCIQHGYRRPGFAARLETAARLEHRWEAAYRIALNKLDIASAPETLIVDEWTRGNVSGWLRHEKPDVVIGPILGRLEELIVESGGHRNLGLAGLMVPKAGDRLSGILQDGEIIGATAADQLIAQIERNETGIPEYPITHTMLGRWNEGLTLHGPKRRVR
jgi:DNA-binding LacI/PurR family transcriptional regulator